METKDIILDLRTKKGLSQDELARIRSGTMTREQFDAWKDEATAKRLEVESGILDMDEYATWLKK